MCEKKIQPCLLSDSHFTAFQSNIAIVLDAYVGYRLYRICMRESVKTWDTVWISYISRYQDQKDACAVPSGDKSFKRSKIASTLNPTQFVDR